VDCLQTEDAEEGQPERPAKAVSATPTKDVLELCKFHHTFDNHDSQTTPSKLPCSSRAFMRAFSWKYIIICCKYFLQHASLLQHKV
jgi:hypothetical protein